MKIAHVIATILSLLALGGCKSTTDEPAKAEVKADTPAKSSAHNAEPTDSKAPPTARGTAKAAGPKDDGDFVPRYGKTENPDLEAALREEKFLESFCADANRTLTLPLDVDVVLEDCDEANAFYDPEHHRITMCYELIETFTKQFDQYARDEEEADAQVMGATMFTMYHELGHALSDIYKLPLTGKEEDAVDQLATVVLLAMGDEGREQALDGAEAFLPDEAEAEFGELAFWETHSFGEQRFYNTLCLVYGKDPALHPEMVEDEMLPHERAEGCVEEYERASAAWATLLKPHLQPTAAGIK